MIKKILNEVEALSFIKPLINDKIYSNPMLKTEEQININLLRVIYDSEDFVIGVYNNEELIGVFSFIIEKEEKYLELLFAYSKDYNAYIEMMNYLINNYKGYNCDFIINPNNMIFIDVLKKYNSIFEPLQYYMELEYIVDYKHNKNIIFYDDKYKDEYINIHEKDMYWTAEKTVEAKDRFKILLAIDNNKVIGYIDYTYRFNNNEPYSLYVTKDYRNKGFGKALLYEAIKDNLPNNMSLRVDYDNYQAINLYEQLGFVKDESNSSILVKVIL